MVRRVFPRLTLLTAALCLATAFSAPALAQGRGPGGGMGGPPPGAGPGFNGGPPPPDGQGRPGAQGPGRSGFQFGPPGRWWDDPSFARSLKLRPEQQTRMDAIFEQNRAVLSTRLQNLQQAESQMQTIANASEPDESALFAQIDRISQARADLEKANTHMLLQVRKEMDPGQIASLEKHR